MSTHGAKPSSPRHSAFAAWIEWTCRTPRNPVLEAAFKEHLAPMGVMCDHIRYDPASTLRGHYPALEIIFPSFAPSGITDPAIKTLWAPMAAIGADCLMFLEDPFRLDFTIADRAQDTKATRAAKEALEAGLVARINDRIEVGLSRFRATVDATYGVMAEPETTDEYLTRLVKNPGEFYKEISEGMLAAETLAAG